MRAVAATTRRAIIEREKKPRPGLKADQELGLRAIFLKLFLERLELDGAHLHSSHMEKLKEATVNFIGIAQEFATQGKKRRTTLTRDARGELWLFSDSQRLAA